MAGIQSAAAEIRRGKKRKKKKEEQNHSMKIYMVSLLHRATIINLRHKTLSEKEGLSLLVVMDWNLLMNLSIINKRTVLWYVE